MLAQIIFERGVILIYGKESKKIPQLVRQAENKTVGNTSVRWTRTLEVSGNFRIRIGKKS